MTQKHPISLKILVTGGAGFIGRYLVEHLLENHQVAIYDNLSNSSMDNIKPLLEKGAKFQYGDILDYKELEKSCSGYDLIIHLAAKSDVAESEINPDETNAVNVEGTTNVLKCCVKNKIGKLIFASSAAVYGNYDFEINENTKLNPQSPYGKSKVLGEQEIEKFSRKYNIDAISFRMFNVYGKDDRQSGVISKFVRNISNDESIVINGDGKQTRDFISIDDVVSAFDCAIKNIDGKRGSAYNIATGKSITIGELAELIIKKSGKKIQVKHKEALKGDIKNSKASVVLAQKELGFLAKHQLSEDISQILGNSNV
ncbi:MAG: NAD-dependent epimerase/dehydratase family protein [Candidatus Nitrosomaritimum yanchengensis]